MSGGSEQGKERIEKEDEELEQLLVSRWLYRGGILALVGAFATILTILGSRGLTSVPEQVVAGVLVLCGFAAGAVFFVMRQQDHALLRTLRHRRKREAPGAAARRPVDQETR